MHKKLKQYPTLGAILLIAGTAIGAGMLALPVSTAQYGFGVSTLFFISSWLFMTLAALLLLEVNLRLPKNTNLISMARITLGRGGVVVAWISYLFLLYALLAAYLSGLSAILHDVLNLQFHISTSMLSCILAILFVSSIFLHFGIRWIDSLNRLLMAGLILTFILLISGLIPKINFNLLHHMQFNQSWQMLPVIFTTFGYQIIIPSLRDYLHNEPHRLHFSIIVGSLIPLIIYIIWEFLILGVVPLQGVEGLQTILASGQPQVGLSHVVQMITQQAWVAWGFRLFATFAIATSFLGVALSLYDFLTDGLKIKRTNIWGHLKILLYTFLLPFFFASLFPRGFILALEYAGIFVAILLVIFPALMAYRARHHRHVDLAPNHYQVMGGNFTLIAVMLFGLSAIVTEILLK